MGERSGAFIVLLFCFCVLVSTSGIVFASSDDWVEWSQIYGGPNDDQARSVVATSDGGFASAGFTESFGAGDADFWLVKTDGSGNVEWNQTYGGEGSEWGSSLIQTSDGGFVITGRKPRYNGDIYGDCWLVRTDFSGNMVWDQTYGGEGSDVVKSIVETSDGGFALAGYTSSFNAEFNDCWMIKTDDLGNLEWNQIYGGPNIDRANALIATSDGGFALACQTESFGAGEYDFWLIKTDMSGNIEWNQTYGGPRNDVPYSLLETSGGGFVLAGHTRSIGHGNEDFWLVKTDKSGNMEWDRFYGSSEHEIAYSLIKNSDSGYTLAGAKEFWIWNDQGFWEPQHHDFWVVRTNVQGIPEFPSWIILPLFVVATLVVLIVSNKLSKKEIK